MFGNSWAKGSFFRIIYVRRAKTVSKVLIPKAVQKEAELIFQDKIDLVDLPRELLFKTYLVLISGIHSH